MQTRDLEGAVIGISDLVKDVDTIGRVVRGFVGILDNYAQSPLKIRLEAFIKATIQEMVEVGRIQPTSSAYVELINPFYKKYFGEDAPSFVIRNVTYRLHQ